MTRPDPHQVTRRPQASARPAVAYRQARAAARAPFTADGRFDPALFYELLDTCTVAVEGAPAPGDGRFYGSAVWALPLPAEDARRLAACIDTDPRARRVLDDQVHREAARLLGADLPPHLSFHLSAQLTADGLQLTVDLEDAADLRRLGHPR